MLKMDISRGDLGKSTLKNGVCRRSTGHLEAMDLLPSGDSETALATKFLKIQSKRYYLDIKENCRGRFLKIAEITADGRRNQIYLALSTAAEFRDHLSQFSNYYAGLGPTSPKTNSEDTKLMSEIMFKDTRRYYIDLKENEHGRYLRLSQSSSKGAPRLRIAIPAQGMVEVRDALTDLLNEVGTDNGGMYPELPEERHLKVEKKNFYFDIGYNKHGIFMRISELTNNYRNAITMPDKGWESFRDILIDYCAKLKQLPKVGSTVEKGYTEGLLSKNSNGITSYDSDDCGNDNYEFFDVPDNN